MDWLVPTDQAQLLCGALGILAVASFVLTKAAEVLRLIK